MYFEGVVVRGRCLGREFGFPTANVLLPAGFVISGGVYRSRVTVGGRSFNAVTNIGVNPTVGRVERRSESYILDFNQDIYGEKIGVEIEDKLRDEMRFESVEALKIQIAQDVERVIEML